MQKTDIDTKKTKERSLLAQISHAKDELITPDEMELNAGGDFVKRRLLRYIGNIRLLCAEIMRWILMT